MAKIEFVSLGGQDEKNKGCYALIIDNDIYVLGCGIKCLSNAVLGIKKIIADFTFLIENKQQIKGIFIPTPNYESFGGLEFLLKKIGNVPIYTSNLGQNIINNFFEQKLINKQMDNNNSISLNTKFNVNAIKPLTPLKIGKINVMGFRTTSFIPQSLGFVFNTTSGAIVFVDQFIIPTHVNNSFYDILHEINKFARNNIFLLITSVGDNIDNASITSPKYDISSFYENCIVEMQNRGIFAIEEKDIYKLLKLIKLIETKSIPLYIYSGSFVHTLTYMQHNRIVNFRDLILIKENQINTINRGIIIVTNNRQNLLAKLQKIALGEDDRLSFKETDTFVYSLNTLPGYEKIEANLFDDLNHLNISKIIKLPKDILTISQSQEDHKILINILKPKYIIPINNLYMNFAKYKTICRTAYILQDNILILSNGQFAKFDQNKLIDNKQHINIVEQYIGSNGLYDVGSNGLYECQQMADSGCVLINLYIDKITKSIKNFNYKAIGVINLNDEKNKAIINEINSSLNVLITNVLKDKTNTENLSRDEQEYFKKQVLKQYEKKLNKRPLVLLTIVYCQTKSNNSNNKNI